MRKTRPTNRYCAKCGSRYFRCNKFSIWDVQNPGHRGGWHKTQDAYCTDCQPAKAAQKLLVVASTAATIPKSHLTLVKKRA